MQPFKMGQGGTVFQLVNCRVLQSDHTLARDDLWYQDGKIIDPRERFYHNKSPSDVKIDCDGLIVAPGFIDLQINGAFGIDFSSTENLAQGLRIVSLNLLQYGVTSYTPTIVSSSPEFYRQVLPLLKPTSGSPESGATILGAHLEGPFINETKLGCHDKRFLVNFSRGFQTLYDIYGPQLSNARIVTVAPEIEGGLDVIAQLRRSNIVVGAGHSAATVAQGELAVQAGTTFITHLFNAMNQFHHRDPGLVGLLGSSEKNGFKRPFYSLICDGVHVHPNSVKIAHDAHAQGAVLITDAMAAMGLTQGALHHLGSKNVVISQRSEAFLEGTSTLAGSVTNMPQCVRNFKEFTGCTLVEALEAASLHPAQLLGISDKKGTLTVGADADFIVIDDNINVRATFVNGQLAWKSQPRPPPDLQN